MRVVGQHIDGIGDGPAAPAETQADENFIKQGLTPIKRWGKPIDIAKPVVAIVSGLLPFSTGSVIDIDGGFHIHRL